MQVVFFFFLLKTEREKAFLPIFVTETATVSPYFWVSRFSF